MSVLNVTVRVVDDAKVVEIDGDLDSHTAEAAQDRITAAVHESGEVVVDLSRVRYMSSGGLRVILLLYRHAQCLGARVALVGLSDDLRLLMRATGFLDFFTVAESIGAGIVLLRSKAAS